MFTIQYIIYILKIQSYIMHAQARMRVYACFSLMVMDGARAQVEGEFRRKLHDDGCHIKQTEPHTQSSTMGKGGVRELKHGVGRQMIRSACPNQLWDDCIIREAYVRSYTYLDIFGLEGQVPEIKVKGETVDIFTISEYTWYEWLKFRDATAKFPVSKIQLDRDVGAAIDICPVMARKIMKENGQVMYCISVRSLTPDEIQSPSERKESEAFDAAIEDRYGLSTTDADFKDDPDYADFVTPNFECYEDDEVPASKIPYIDHVKYKYDIDTYDQYVVA
jgi:hypothetical protein